MNTLQKSFNKKIQCTYFYDLADTIVQHFLLKLNPTLQTICDQFDCFGVKEAQRESLHIYILYVRLLLTEYSFLWRLVHDYFLAMTRHAMLMPICQCNPRAHHTPMQLPLGCHENQAAPACMLNVFLHCCC